MNHRAIVLASLFTLGACASTVHTLGYSADWPDADVTVGNQRYQVWFHDKDPTVLIQHGAPRPLGQMLAQNLTIYSQAPSSGIAVWGAAANAVLNQIRCSATEVTGADQMREVRYQCDAGVDVGAAVAEHRAQWRQGVRVDAPVPPPGPATGY
jgi:hypothetical protein